MSDTTTRSMHDRDFNLWLENTIATIKNRELDKLDYQNLIYELEDMGASQKRALRSYTQRLVEHLLKIEFWHSERERCLKGWQQEVTNFRNQIDNILEDSPSLKNYLIEKYPKIYSQAVSVVSYDFEVPKDFHLLWWQALGR